ncbi:hypothetical protein CEW46_21550 [Bacillus cereus]|nr:hypothetical protein CEW46_21550 [Bacillus cereus]
MSHISAKWLVNQIAHHKQMAREFESELLKIQHDCNHTYPQLLRQDDERSYYRCNECMKEFYWLRKEENY